MCFNMGIYWEFNPFPLLLLLLPVPLVVVTDPVNTTVQLGEMAAFFCSFSGSPPPSQIQWFMEGSSDPLSLPKYDVTISEDYLSSTLSFEAALEDHDTQYYCRAMQTLVTGEIVVLSDAATLTVNCKCVLSLCFTHSPVFDCLV